MSYGGPCIGCGAMYSGACEICSRFVCLACSEAPMLLGYTRCCRIPEKVIADAAIARRRGVEPSDVTAARDAVAAFDQHGECPTIANAKHSCRWTCRTCNRALDGTGYSHTTMHPKYTVSWVKTRRICHLWVPPVGVVDRDLVSGDRVRE